MGIYARTKKHSKNEQRSRNVAAKKELILVNATALGQTDPAARGISAIGQL